MAGTNIGKAFVQIVPSAKGVTADTVNIMKGAALTAGNSAGSNLIDALKSSAKKAIAGFSIGALITKSLDIGGSLEQSYIGGLETLYGDAAKAARQYAREASTAGISMNDYAEQAVSFGAALKSAYGGDTLAAAKAANTAIMDMADNAAKMGTPLESIQNAYQGFAKQNYTMLDNLKLGYGGTKSEMERLLADAQKLTGVEYNIDNLGDVYSAISAIQGELGLTGVAANEASETFSGSFNAMKAAAENLMGSLMLGENVVPAMETLVTSVTTFLGKNLFPAVKRIFANVPDLLLAGGNMISTLAKGITSKIPVLVSSGLKALSSFSEKLRGSFGTFVDSGLELIQNIVKGIVDAIPGFVAEAPAIISNFAGLINDNAPKLIEAGKNILLNLWEGVKSLVSSIQDNWDSVLQSLFDVWEAINWVNLGKGLITGIQKGIALLKNKLPEALKKIGGKAVELFEKIKWGKVGRTVIGFIGKGLSALASSIPTILRTIGGKAIELFKKIKWLELGKTVIKLIVKGLGLLLTNIPKKLAEIGASAVKKVKEIDWLQLGKDIINGMISGITSLGSSLWNKIKSVATGAKEAAEEVDFSETGKSWMDGLVGGITSKIDLVKRKTAEAGKKAYDELNLTTEVSSPSRAFMRTGKWWMEGLSLGISRNTDLVYDALGSLDSKMYKQISPVALSQPGAKNIASALGQKQVTINNEITVNGSDNPETFAQSLVRQMKMDMRSI